MPSRSGWTVLLASVALITTGRIFGIFELFLVGACGVALVVVAIAVVSLTRLRVDVRRELHPAHLHAGTPSRVEIAVTNRGARRTPLLTLRDPVGQRRAATVTLAPLRPGTSARAAYSLPTERRGVVEIGPLRLQVSDPFGLASAAAPAAPVVHLTVWPAVEDLLPLPHTHGDDPHAGADHPNVLTAGGEDFYALRPYVVGDDLRRVHWRSTARRGELMVRQDEMPWQGRSTVVLDTRRAAHDERTFEQAVSAAASLTVACARHRHLVRLVTTDGYDSGFGSSAPHTEAILEKLATVALADGGHLGTVLGAVRRAGAGGALAVLVGGRAEAASAVAGLRRGYGHLSVIAFGPAVAGAHLTIGAGQPFGPAWDSALRHRRRAPAASTSSGARR